MPGLMIIAHAPLASSLKAVAEHTFPDCSRTLEALDVLPEHAARGSRGEGARDAGAGAHPEALIFTDVFGATPCNVAQRLADGAQVKVIAGVNVPMLWRSLCYATNRSSRRRAGDVRGDTGRDAGGDVRRRTRPSNRVAMIKTTITISNKLGLHARASAKLTKLAGSFHSEIYISRNDRRVNAKSIMGVMMLAAGIGTGRDRDRGRRTNRPRWTRSSR